ncbi:Aste57867_8364 [Aphanomyces stellatus]|uniref:chitin synthase n=1 Tax=Aphanomyces stellatus TaxID=120398 RepID=A0A485KK49_9STRA|nr:hypothetical protein As57867_008332 [Aphanomyces stellatus]VFT85250.1 Aste57867_8364 [Aphanomyces stellatus]
MHQLIATQINKAQCECPAHAKTKLLPRTKATKSSTITLGGQRTAEKASYVTFNGDLTPRAKQQLSATELIKRAEKLDYYLQLAYGYAKQIEEMAPIATVSLPLMQKSWEGQDHLPPYQECPEFTDMRYTAVRTRDPIHFSTDGYELRVKECGKAIKVFVTITMYNEPASQLESTLTGLAKGIAYMCEQHGYDYWQHVAISIVADGRSKINPSMLTYLSKLGCFDKHTMVQVSMGIATEVHLFESTVQLPTEVDGIFYPPVQVIFALKESNNGKLHSHLWFFNAFCEQMQPKYTVLVDVGTIPAETSVYRLIRSMERNPQIGGVAGEIAVDKPQYFNPVIAAQHFEYKIANIMDASLQSVFGFIGVLPGAFSAYRYEAIRASDGEGPLVEYFKSLTASKKELGLFVGNMYLAEDRILCFEILARRDCKWTMHYVKDAIASTDVPENLVDLIKQRRRWLNGSFFAGLFAIWNFGRVWRDTSHSIPRKLAFTMQFSYMAILNVLNWFLLSNLFLTFYYILSLALYYRSPTLLRLILTLYFVLVGSLIVFALGNKPGRRTAAFYRMSSYIMGSIMLGVTFISLYALSGQVHFLDIRPDLVTCTVADWELPAGAMASIGLVFLSAFSHGEFTILASTLQYYFMLPTFVNILGIYAYSNLHDLSWGTKGIDSSGHGGGNHNGGTSIKHLVAVQLNTANLDVTLEADQRKQSMAAEHEDVDSSFRVFRSVLLLAWLLTNGAWLYFATTSISCSCYLKYLSYTVAIFNIIRFFGALIFLGLRVTRGTIQCAEKMFYLSSSECLPRFRAQCA